MIFGTLLRQDSFFHKRIFIIIIIIIINDIYMAQTSPRSKCAKSAVAQ